MRKLETTVDLLDALQEKLGCDSDNQVAQRIPIPQGTLSNWRCGRAYPTEVHAITIAEVLEIPPALVLVIAAADRTDDKAARAKWRELIVQIARSGYGVLAALAVATGSYTTSVDTTDRGVGIMSHRKRKRPADPLAA